MVITRNSRSKSRVRRLAPSGIWLSVLRPSPPQPWQAWQLPLSMNNCMPSRMSAALGACARAAEAAIMSIAMTAAPVAAGRKHRRKFRWTSVNSVLARLFAGAQSLPVCRSPSPSHDIQADWRYPALALQSAYATVFARYGSRQVKRNIAAARSTALLALALAACPAAGDAQGLRRANIWDLKLG